MYCTKIGRPLLGAWLKAWFQLCFNLNRIHDSVGKALRTANESRVTANSHPLSNQSFFKDLQID
jgi:hypothetical protein